VYPVAAASLLVEVLLTLRLMWKSLTGLIALVVACSGTSTGNPSTTASGSSSGETSSSSSGDTTSGGSTSSGSSSSSSSGAIDDAAIDRALAGRPYKSFTPAGYDASKPAPLVILLHGYSGNGAFINSYLKFSEATSKRGIFAAYSDGTVDSRGNKFWNATDSCCNFFSSPVDDVGYIGAIISDMQRKFAIDPKRIFIAGHSNGGFMSHRMACEIAPRLAGIVSLAGAVYTDASKCSASSPVAVLQIHGTADATVKYEGGVFAAGIPAYPSAKQTVKTWAGKNGCTGELAPKPQTLDLDSQIPGAETTVASYTCSQGAAELWTIPSGAHVPSVTPAFTESVLDFLMAHPKP
jgi:polyhydroxybutyrate depolymerase